MGAHRPGDHRRALSEAVNGGYGACGVVNVNGDNKADVVESTGSINRW
jgi:hypothetical protein